MATPVVVTDSGGLPIVNVAGHTPMTPNDTFGIPVTIVTTNGTPVSLVNEDLTASDFTAPTLSDAAGAQDATDTTSANISVSTNEANGTLYWVTTSHGTPPTAEQVIAGQTSTGGATSLSGNVAITTTGTQSINTGSGAGSGQTFVHFAQQDAAGNNSNVATASFTMAA